MNSRIVFLRQQLNIMSALTDMECHSNTLTMRQRFALLAVFRTKISWKHYAQRKGDRRLHHRKKPMHQQNNGLEKQGKIHLYNISCLKSILFPKLEYLMECLLCCLFIQTLIMTQHCFCFLLLFIFPVYLVYIFSSWTDWFCQKSNVAYLLLFSIVITEANICICQTAAKPSHSDIYPEIMGFAHYLYQFRPVLHV